MMPGGPYVAEQEPVQPESLLSLSSHAFGLFSVCCHGSVRADGGDDHVDALAGFLSACDFLHSLPGRAASMRLRLQTGAG